jgi:hypothetical protein
MRRWAAGAPSPDVAIPAEPIRCLGRVLWGKQKRGLDSVWVRCRTTLAITCSLMYYSRRVRWTRCNLVRVSSLGRAHSGDSNAADRTSLPPEAAESHTHLAHAVIRYLGLTAPEELAPFGINSAAGIVDLISRVRLRLVLPFSMSFRRTSFSRSLQPIPSRSPHHRWHHWASRFLHWLRWSIIRAIRTRSSYSRVRRKIPRIKSRKCKSSQYAIYRRGKR